MGSSSEFRNPMPKISFGDCIRTLLRVTAMLRRFNLAIAEWDFQREWMEVTWPDDGGRLVRQWMTCDELADHVLRLHLKVQELEWGEGELLA